MKETVDIKDNKISFSAYVNPKTVHLKFHDTWKHNLELILSTEQTKDFLENLFNEIKKSDSRVLKDLIKKLEVSK